MLNVEVVPIENSFHWTSILYACKLLKFIEIVVEDANKLEQYNDPETNKEEDDGKE